MVQWKKTKLGALSDRITKGSTPTTYGYKFLDDGIPFVKVENLANGLIARESITQYISEDAHEFQKRSQLQEGDVLFSIAGTIGRVAIVTEKDVPANTNQAVAIIRGVTKHFMPDFLKMQLDSHVSLKVKSKARGGAMNNISLDDLKEMDVVVPPLDVQDNIVRAVDTQFTRLDAAIKSLKAIKVKLALYRKSILNAAFDGYLSKSKLAFEEKLIKDIAKIKGGKRLPRGQRVQDESTRFPYIRVTDFENYSVNLQELKFITESAHKQISRYVIYDNEVFISIAGTIGRVGIIPPQLNGANLTENAAKLTDIEGILPKFLMYYLSSPKSEELISFSTKSTSQPKLALFRIGNLKVKYPFNKKDQQQIVDEIESRFSIIDNLEKVIYGSFRKSKILRNSILKSAFEGKLI